MFEDYGNGELNNNQLVESMKIIKGAKNELKAYTKSVSVYRRITKPYYDAKNLIVQAEQ